MKFEYDENKSKINKEKHGIDFVEAQNLWQNENALIIPANIVDDDITTTASAFPKLNECPIFPLEVQIPMGVFSGEILMERIFRKGESPLKTLTTLGQEEAR